jgi:hypothetical protein
MQFLGQTLVPCAYNFLSIISILEQSLITI